jgi:hypothetical protein
MNRQFLKRGSRVIASDELPIMGDDLIDRPQPCTDNTTMQSAGWPGTAIARRNPAKV